MESIYYVVSYVCHRRCKHCYEDRFRPYQGAALEEQLAQASQAMPRIIEHFPERMSYLDLAEPLQSGGYAEKVGRIILAGGEALLEPVRSRITYPALARLAARYPGGRVKLIVQTTGDLLTEALVEELLARQVYMISVSGLDDYHVGLEGAEQQERLRDHLRRIFEAHGMHLAGEGARSGMEEVGPVYNFFGATPDSWIGRLWPRGRAWQNSLSRATLQDNFCNRWSGGLGFLRHRYSGSEVSVEPEGNVYPCCVKTRFPLGNLQERQLIDILDELAADPVYQAISDGHPERMGLAQGWSTETFLEKSRTQTPGGLPYQNLCIGCDRFHEEVLGPLRRKA